MQEIKTLMLRVDAVANTDEYVFDGPMTDAHIQGYLNQGFTLHTVYPGTLTPNYVSVFYVLIRETPETQIEMDVSKAQEQVNQLVSDELSVAGKWAETVAPVPA